MKIPLSTKKAIIVLLAEVLESDNTVSPDEISYIFSVANELELTEEEVKHILRHPDEHSLKPPSDEPTRMIILYYVLFFMKTDGNVHPKEERIVTDIGLGLGFRPELITRMIGVIKDHIDREVPPEEMIKHIRAYLN